MHMINQCKNIVSVLYCACIGLGLLYRDLIGYLAFGNWLAFWVSSLALPVLDRTVQTMLHMFDLGEICD